LLGEKGKEKREGGSLIPLGLPVQRKVIAGFSGWSNKTGKGKRLEGGNSGSKRTSLLGHTEYYSKNIKEGEKHDENY